MAKDLTKRADTVAPKHAAGAASRLKGALMEDALDRLLGKGEPIAAPDNKPPRVVFGVAAFSADGWTRAKALQRELFNAASSLEVKLAYYGPDDPVSGVRPCRIARRWVDNPDAVAGLIDKATCTCGCYIDIRSVLGQAVKEAEGRPLRAVIIVADHFHDAQNGLDEAAIAANQLRRMGTKVFLMQLSGNPTTAQKLQYLARVSGAVHFQFDPRTQEQQLAEMSAAVSTYVAGGEEAVKATGGQAATLLLQHLKQMPMPIIEERARVQS